MLLTCLLAASFLHSSLAQKAVHLSSVKNSWTDAENCCVQRKGHLVGIQNAFQGTFLTGLAQNCQSYYVGGKCNQGKCTWTDGTTFAYTNWAPGQPGAGQYISVNAKTGYWQTVDGSSADCFICAQDAPMTDCQDWRKSGFTDDGYYTIIENKQQAKVSCDMTTDNGGWTVIQRRVDGSDDFWNNTWAQYKDGFGTPEKNYWAGNELIHQLSTKDKEVNLRIDMKDDGTPGSPQAGFYWWNVYNHFQVSAESDNYTLHLDIDWQKVQGNASDGWYDITYSSGAPFSTIDRINDPQKDCVTKYQMGGWWLKFCALSSLNGAYVPLDWSTGYGLFWIVGGGDTVIHPRKTSMMIRRVDP